MGNQTGIQAPSPLNQQVIISKKLTLSFFKIILQRGTELMQKWWYSDIFVILIQSTSWVSFEYLKIHISYIIQIISIEKSLTFNYQTSTSPLIKW